VPIPTPSIRIDGAMAHTLTPIPCERTVNQSAMAPNKCDDESHDNKSASEPLDKWTTHDGRDDDPSHERLRPNAACDGLIPSAVWKNSEMT